MGEEQEGQGQPDRSIGDSGVAEGDIECEPCESPAALPTPRCQTAQERELHDLHHFDFRSWCDACMKGGGQAAPHPSRVPPAL